MSDYRDALEVELGSLRRLWLVLAVIGLVAAVGVWVDTQGGHLRLSFKALAEVGLADGTPEAIAALWGNIAGSILVSLTSVVLLVHARKASGNWGERYAFRLFDLPAGKGPGLFGQGIALVVLTLLPVYMVWHSFRVLMEQAVICSEASGTWQQLSPRPDMLFGSATGPVKLSSNHADACTQDFMTDYWLPWQSWALLLFSVIATALLLWSLVEVFWQPRFRLRIPGARRAGEASETKL